MRKFLLLLGLFVVSVPAWGGERGRSQVAPEDVKRLEELGGLFHSEHGVDGRGKVIAVNMPSPTLENVEQLTRDFPEIKQLRFGHFSEEIPSLELLGEALCQLHQLEQIGLQIPLDDELAKQLARHPQLKRLGFRLGNLSLEGVEKLSPLREVELISMTVPEEQDQEAAALLKLFPGLKILDYTALGSTPQTLFQMGQLKELIHLTVTAHDQPASRHQIPLTELENLEFLSFSSRSSQVIGGPLGLKPALKTVLIYANVTDQELESFSELQAVERIVLHSELLTDQGLKFVKHLKTLKDLEISSSQFTGAGLVSLKDLDHLENVHLDHNPNLQPESITHLVSVTSLKNLSVAWTPLRKNQGWKSLESLKDLPNLKHIWIEDQDGSWDTLRAAMPDVEIYYFD